MRVLLWLACLCVAAALTAPGQQITLPGPAFPIYADKVPLHHMPASPQAISGSDVTFLKSENSDMQNDLAAVIGKEAIQPLAPTTPLHQTVEQTTSTVPSKENQPRQALQSVTPASAPPSAAAAGAAPSAAAPSAALQALPQTAKPPAAASIQRPQPMQANPLSLMQFPVGGWQQMFLGNFLHPQILTQGAAGSRPSAPAPVYHLRGGSRVGPMLNPVQAIPSSDAQVPWGYPHMGVLPPVNPFKGTSFEKLPFPYSPLGAPFLGTPMGLGGPFYLASV